jgi:hypothetical protein
MKFSKIGGFEMGYLVCDRCNDYYKLHPGEYQKYFDVRCKCGGRLKYASVVTDDRGKEKSFPDNTRLMNCPDCNHPMSTKAKSCPNCGYSKPNNKLKGIVGIIVMGLLVLFIFGLIGLGLFFILCFLIIIYSVYFYNPK